jgi:hypothetical protein
MNVDNDSYKFISGLSSKLKLPSKPIWSPIVQGETTVKRKPQSKNIYKKKQRNKNSEINTTTKEKPNQKKQVER